MKNLSGPLTAAFLLIAPVVAQADKTKPNIVYIMADELGYFELSCLQNPNIKTPNIDRMAAEGIRFTQAMAGSSVCAPTRCCLMTGKHAGHTSVRSNGGGTPLRANEPTVASALKQVGYATGGFGKWGCGGRGSTGVPEKHGFDTFVGYYDQVHAHSYYPPYLIENSEELPLAGNRGGSDGATYSQYVIFDRAVEFIRAHHEQPFFCYLPITPPHGNFDIPNSDPAWKIYEDKPWPEQAKRYAAMVSMVDRQVGEVLALLKDLQLDETTLVFFSGDNGGNDYFASKEFPRGFHGANVDPQTGVEFRGTKGTLYEGGLRIPMVARWPGKIAPQQVSDLLWYFPDLFPTVAELAGAPQPDDLDGISIVPTLLGEKGAGRAQQQHDFLYWEIGGQIAIRQGDWKAVKSGDRRTKGKVKKLEWELYDLKTDVSEAHDLAERKPDVLAKLLKLAQSAHTDAVEGSFSDTKLHQRDRQAKFGFEKKGAAGATSGKVFFLPPDGLLDNKDWKIVRASSESTANGKLANNAIDGDPRTLWHSSFSGQRPAAPPHELVIDLGQPRSLTALRYLARQDAGWNGAIGEFEIYVGDSEASVSQRAVAGKFKKTREPQQVDFAAPVSARFVLLRALSEVNGGPWASVAELGLVGQ